MTPTATTSVAMPCWKTPRTRYVHSEKGLVATIGVKDLVIVDTPDALLVADRTAQKTSPRSSRD